ncbi:hypothetical protein [Paraburkholderia bryophila]|uniref:Putative membrane protein n=1 Tax=Paraburkholderia bryophila TaxID=420952 RepID=A0A7Y9WID4_9BURK|nr:hypothetical protein [Paraburkholderia bryophila]NYH21374.1 putative membrane protein [Paraburkholderia bryophila]
MKPKFSIHLDGRIVFRLATVGAVFVMASSLAGLSHPSNAAMGLSVAWSLFWMVLEIVWSEAEDNGDDDDDLASRW